MSEPASKRVKKSSPYFQASRTVFSTHNPIRAIVDSMNIQPHPSLRTINLALGDPTGFSISQVPPQLSTGAFGEVQRVLSAPGASLKAVAGYAPSVGTVEARQAIADAENARLAGCQPDRTPDHVIIASGCSGALEMCIASLIDAGKNIVTPAPGFSIYGTIASYHSGSAKTYKLLPERGWEVDIEDLDAQIDENTVAIVVNNPSNPCGSVYSEDHLLAIAEVAYRRKLPIIADEVYADIVYDGACYTPLAKVIGKRFGREVAVLSCGGIAKKYCLPGWRLGWIVMYDSHDEALRIGAVDETLKKASQVIIGASTLVQALVPALLNDTPGAYFQYFISLYERNARTIVEKLADVPELTPITPHGAMYCLIKLPETLEDDVKFCEDLAADQSVVILPGKCFHAPGYVRVVLCCAQPDMAEAIDRLITFTRKRLSN